MNLYDRQKTLNLDIPNKVYLFIPANVLFTGEVSTKLKITDLNPTGHTSALTNKCLNACFKEYCHTAFDKYMLLLETLVAKLRTIGVKEVVYVLPDSNDYLLDLTLDVSDGKSAFSGNRYNSLLSDNPLLSTLSLVKDFETINFKLRGLTLEDIKEVINFEECQFTYQTNFNTPFVLKRLTNPIMHMSCYTIQNFDLIDKLNNRYNDQKFRTEFKRSFVAANELDLSNNDTIITLQDDTMFKSLFGGLETDEKYKAYESIISENIQGNILVFNTEFKCFSYVTELTVSEYLMKTFKAVLEPKVDDKGNKLWDSLSYPVLTLSNKLGTTENWIYQSEIEAANALAAINGRSKVHYNLFITHFRFFNSEESTLISTLFHNMTNLNISFDVKRLGSFVLRDNTLNKKISELQPICKNLDLLKSMSEDLLIEFICNITKYYTDHLYSARSYLDFSVAKSIDILDIKVTKSRTSLL